MIKREYLQLMQREKFDEAEYYRMASAPKKLYIFLPMYNRGNAEVNRRNIETLGAKEIWAASRNSLNDPYEFKTFYLDEEKANQYGHPVDIYNQLIDGIRDRNLIVSFTADVNDEEKAINNMPMWAYYANNHQGICIEYEVENAAFLYPVYYEKDRIPLMSVFANYFNLIQDAMDAMISPEDKELIKYQSMTRALLFTKQYSWVGENEYRLLIPTAKPIGNSSGKRIKLTGCGLKMKSIYIGQNCNDRVTNIVYREMANKTVNIFKMAIDETTKSFGMNATPIKY